MTDSHETSPSAPQDPSRLEAPSEAGASALARGLWLPLYLLPCIALPLWIGHQYGAWAAGKLLLYAGGGGFIGWITNKAALAMLFRPRAPWPRRPPPRWFWPNRVPAGLIVKRQRDLARAIRRFVESHLLNEDTLDRQLQNIHLREKIAGFLYETAAPLMNSDGESLDGLGRRLATPDAPGFDPRDLAGRIAEAGLALARREASRPAVRTQLATLIRGKIDAFCGQPLRTHLGATERHSLAEAAARRLTAWLATPEAARLAEQHGKELLDQFDEARLDPAKIELRDALDRALPDWIARGSEELGRYLVKPEVARTLRASLAEKAVEIVRAKLSSLAGPFAALLPGRETFQGLFAREIAEQWPSWSQALTREIGQRRDEIAGELRSTFDEAWNRPWRERLPTSMRERLAEATTRSVIDALRDSLSEERVTAFIEERLGDWAEQSLAELLPVAPETLAGRVREKAEDALDAACRPGTPLYAEIDAWAQRVAAPALRTAVIPNPFAAMPDEKRCALLYRGATWLEEQLRTWLPNILESVNMGDMIERELAHFAPEDMERVARETAGPEMRGIEWVGGVAGALATGIMHLIFGIWLA